VNEDVSHFFEDNSEVCFNKGGIFPLAPSDEQKKETNIKTSAIEQTIEWSLDIKKEMAKFKKTKKWKFG
jgi:hypothetical protein